MSVQPCDFAGSTQCGIFQQCVVQTINATKFYCKHDSILPITPYTGFMYSLIPPSVGIAIMGGLGGGIIKGPILELALNYYQDMATQIASCLMIGASIVNTILLLFEKNPDYPTRPIINFEIAVIFNCAISLGTNFGSYFERSSSQLNIQIIQEVFLFASLPYLIFKGLKLRKIENFIRDAKPEPSDPYLQLRLSLDAPFIDLNKSFSQLNTQVSEKVVLFQYFERRQNLRFPQEQLGIIFIFFSVTQILLWMTSTPSQNSIIGLHECSVWDTIVLILMVIVNIMMTCCVYFYGRRVEVRKNSCLFQMDERYYNPKSFALLYLAGFGAGLTTGLFGYGAGITLVPVMLYVNVQARVATSTSAFNYFWLSLNNLFLLISNDFLTPNTITWFLFLAFIGGSVVAKLGYMILNRYRLTYLLIFIIVGFDIANMSSGIAYTIIQSQRFGFNSLTTSSNKCV